ncbi:MAG TPA: hypothetical protein VGF28_05280 [Thermoanaerobaculia bacterium]|jgi:hypothetical protein
MIGRASRFWLLGWLLFGGCAAAPAVLPTAAVAEECPRQVPRFLPEMEWTSERRERDFAELDLRVSPCVEPGGELHLGATVVGREGIGCWDDAGIGMLCRIGRGVLVQDQAPRIIVAEGGNASASAPHFESATGPWDVRMRRFAPFGAGHRMHFEAVARIAPDAAPRELTLEVEAEAHRRDWDAQVVQTVSMKRSVRTRIAAKCAAAAR